MADQQQHLIPPPHDQVYKWWEEACKRPPSSFYEKLDYVAEQAAQWGSDQELEACCEWVGAISGKYGPRLRLARRPKPTRLAEEAQKALAHLLRHSSTELGSETIRRALERLQELEGGND